MNMRSRITRMEGWVEQMRKLQYVSKIDKEQAEVKADEILCECLEYLGCITLVDEYRKVK